MIRLYSIAFVLTAWLAAPAFAARATEAERYYLGDYAVRIADGDRPTRCRVSIVWANDVGGEFTSTGCEVWPDVAEAARWWFDADAGEARFEDPVHKRRFTVAETDAGFVAILSDDTHLWLENLPKRRKR